MYVIIFGFLLAMNLTHFMAWGINNFSNPRSNGINQALLFTVWMLITYYMLKG